jgi:hypothetical protein
MHTAAMAPKAQAAKRTGGVRADIDLKMVEALASVGATNVEIAHIVGVDESTLWRRCNDLLQKTRQDLKVRLRRAQLTAAFQGNPTMLIWLGKQMLGQADIQFTGDLSNMSDEELQALADGKLRR